MTSPEDTPSSSSDSTDNVNLLDVNDSKLFSQLRVTSKGKQQNEQILLKSVSDSLKHSFHINQILLP